MRYPLQGFRLCRGPWRRRLLKTDIFLLSGIVAAAMGCAPENSRIKDNAPTSGAFENHYLLFNLPAVKNKPATTTCIEIPAGSTLDATSNDYRCTFFEYTSASSGRQPTASGGEKGFGGLCSFAGNSSGRNFVCKLKHDKGTDACSAFKETLQDSNGNIASLFQIKGEAKPFQAVAVAAQGTSVAGAAFPKPDDGFSFGEGGCAAKIADLLAGRVPAPSQTAAGAKKVTFELKMSTAIKTSSADSNSAEMKNGEGTKKCTITKPATGAVTLTADKITSSPTLDGRQKYYIVSKLISVSDGTKELCAPFLPNATEDVYLFGDHWTQINM